MALSVFQAPRVASEPEILIVSPNDVVTVSLNVTAIDVGVTHDVLLVEVVVAVDVVLVAVET